MKKIKIDERVVAVNDKGQGAPIVFVHGFPLDSRMWNKQIPEFAKDYRVIAPDLPGFGDSHFAPSQLTMQFFSEVLASMLGKLEIETPVTLVGLSMGGYAVFEFQKQFPSLVKRLVLCNTRASADDETLARTRRVSAQSILENGTEKFVADMILRLVSAKTQEQHPETCEFLFNIMKSASRDSVAAALLGMAKRVDHSDLLSQISVPALIVAGEFDLITPVAEMREMSKKIQNARFKIVAGAGHMTPVEAPEEFNSVLREFLRSTEAG